MIWFEGLGRSAGLFPGLPNEMSRIPLTLSHILNLLNNPLFRFTLFSSNHSSLSLFSHKIWKAPFKFKLYSLQFQLSFTIFLFFIDHSHEMTFPLTNFQWEKWWQEWFSIQRDLNAWESNLGFWSGHQHLMSLNPMPTVFNTISWSARQKFSDLWPRISKLRMIFDQDRIVLSWPTFCCQIRWKLIGPTLPTLLSSPSGNAKRNCCPIDGPEFWYSLSENSVFFRRPFRFSRWGWNLRDWTVEGHDIDQFTKVGSVHKSGIDRLLGV